VSIDRIRLVKVRRRFEASVVPDLAQQVRDEVGFLLQRYQLAANSRVGITAGSRGINDAIGVYQAAAQTLKEEGHQPFLFSSMGSHGRGTADGQRDLLRSLGVTEENIGAPVLCSADVVQLGETEGPLAGLPVYVSREAAEADGILAINRVKPHTSFHGPYESGLMKMLAVGMGRDKGASMVHRLGWNSMVESITSIGGAVLELLPVIGGLAVVENAYEETIAHADLCVVREMGKNYSGTGMDTNVIGRLRLQGIPEPAKPAIQFLAVLDLSEASHGNATGIGLADFTTERLVEKIDYEATYLNCLTSGGPIRAAVPMTLADDKALFEAARQALKPERINEVRLLIVENTLHLQELWLSEVLLEEVEAREDVEAVGEPFPLEFDSGGHLVL
jgi:hypothetical protein